MNAATRSMSFATIEARRRMARPQRHRLLHGYPMRPVMETRLDDSELVTTLNPARELLVGILPHPFCNPAVRGCGFCTFPHEAFSKAKASEVVSAVCRELQAAAALYALGGRMVKALYFGGGTANLTPADSFRDLCRAVVSIFDLSQAEISLEGVPAYFINREPRLLDILRAEIPARHFRISMGMQTFDEGRLAQMGRTAYGNEDTFRNVVRYAHDCGATVSGDLLFNLPGQSLGEMREDVRRAVGIGLDQICLYHLVMHSTLGTEWAADPALLAGLPTNERACDNWRALREMTIGAGYTQTTLTNFERSALVGTDQGYLYEVCGKRPEGHDMLGFGPSGISVVRDKWGRFTKRANPEAAEAYRGRVAGSSILPWEVYFEYEYLDEKILHLTRRIVTLGIERSAYRLVFHGSDPLKDFGDLFDALIGEGLIEDGTLNVTPKGMFYADTIAGLFAWRRIKQIENRRNDSLRSFM
jgi:coproporphyrinogen III oxidase-like Fe-S oxidoreductase